MTEPLRVLSLGAGLQSSCLALMFERGEFDYLPDIAFFSDTQSEERHTYATLNELERTVTKFPIVRVTAGSIEKDTLAAIKDGSRVALPPFYTDTDTGPGPLWRQCTKEYKVDAINHAIRNVLEAGRGVRLAEGTAEVLFGITVDEAQRMRDSHVKWIVNRYPLIDKRMDRNDCTKWMERHGYPTPGKSACYFCPYRSDSSWRRMRDTQPEEWARAVWFDKQIRTGLPGVKHDCYLHRSLRPLDEVDLTTLEDLGQMTLFDGDMDAECEGMCGV